MSDDNKNSTPNAAKFSFWWLHPAWLFGLVCGLTLLVAYWQSNVDFQLYRTVKYINESHLALGCLIVFAFSCGCYFAMESSQTSRSGVRRESLRFWFWCCLALTVFGYVVWLAVGVKNGATPGLLLELLRSDEFEFVDSMREDYFPNIPGVTTCTQFALATTLLGILLYFQGDRYVGKWLVGLFAVACVRAIVLSERMALIELALPAIALAVRLAILSGKTATHWRTLGRVLPLAAPIVLALTFGAFEYFRSWHYYQNQFNSYPQFVVWRLSGYYTTSHNNGAMALATNAARPLPYFTVEALWEFPGVEDSPFGYEELTSVSIVDQHKAMLDNFGNPELNNEGGLFQPLLDWGLPLSLVFWLGYGFLAGRTYSSFQAGTLAGLLIYPAIFLTVIDVPRLLLISDPRLTPSLAMLLLVVFTSKSETADSS